MYLKALELYTGKNNKERIIDSIKSLNGSLALSMSVQSLDEGVLKNIQRDNISVDRMLGLAPTIKESGLRTTAEIIVGYLVKHMILIWTRFVNLLVQN